MPSPSSSATLMRSHRASADAQPPSDVKTYNPAFDVTPTELITAIVTERGMIQPVDAEYVRKVLT